LNRYVADLTEQRNQAIAELVKAMLIINGGGGVALLVFLQSAWVQNKMLVKPVACAVAVLAFGSRSPLPVMCFAITRRGITKVATLRASRCLGSPTCFLRGPH
jgi:hypothetical protein